MTDHRENKPPQVSIDGEVDHLLDWVKVWIVQVPQEPQHTRPEHLQPNKHAIAGDFKSYRWCVRFYISNNAWL